MSNRHKEFLSPNFWLVICQQRARKINDLLPSKSEQTPNMQRFCVLKRNPSQYMNAHRRISFKQIPFSVYVERYQLASTSNVRFHKLTSRYM